MSSWKDYKVLTQLGEGAHGIVVKAQEKSTGHIVALKKITIKSNQIISLSVFREIKCLQLLDHPNIVSLLGVFTHGSSYILCFEYIERDLASILKSAFFRLPSNYIRGWMYMLLSGVSYIHGIGIIHRDLKPANLLINLSGVLKITDFGQSRLFSSSENDQRPMSHQVATRWYRAPELLYGSRNYTNAVDIWAIGCIFGEMLNHFPLFPGQNDIDQLQLVLSTLGTPSAIEWPEMPELPDYPKIYFPDFSRKSFSEILPDAPSDSLELISQMLIYNGKRRITANDALSTSYFKFWKGFNESLVCKDEMQVQLS